MIDLKNVQWPQCPSIHVQLLNGQVKFLNYYHNAFPFHVCLS